MNYSVEIKKYFSLFNKNYYLDNNKDLKFNTINECWDHVINYGFKENRIIMNNDLLLKK